MPAGIALRGPTHEYLDLNCGNDFDTQVIVKTNVVEVLSRELARQLVVPRDGRAGHQHRPLPTR